MDSACSRADRSASTTVSVLGGSVLVVGAAVVVVVTGSVVVVEATGSAVEEVLGLAEVEHAARNNRMRAL